jgi:hypothetical protein
MRGCVARWQFMNLKPRCALSESNFHKGGNEPSRIVERAVVDTARLFVLEVKPFYNIDFDRPYRSFIIPRRNQHLAVRKCPQNPNGDCARSIRLHKGGSASAGDMAEQPEIVITPRQSHQQSTSLAPQY